MSDLPSGKLILHGLKRQYLRLKLQFSLSHREADFQEGEHLFGAGLLLACKTHLVALLLWQFFSKQDEEISPIFQLPRPLSQQPSRRVPDSTACPTTLHFPFLAGRDLRGDFALAAVALDADAALCRRTIRSITATRVSSSSSKPP